MALLYIHIQDVRQSHQYDMKDSVSYVDSFACERTMYVWGTRANELELSSSNKKKKN